MELVSDPFDEGDCVAVRAIRSSNSTAPTIKLPVSILAGWEDLFQELANPTVSEPPQRRRKFLTGTFRSDSKATWAKD
jgi:hypothetical protein